jgi:hypothetical protein
MTALALSIFPFLSSFCLFLNIARAEEVDDDEDGKISVMRPLAVEPLLETVEAEPPEGVRSKEGIRPTDSIGRGGATGGGRHRFSVPERTSTGGARLSALATGLLDVRRSGCTVAAAAKAAWAAASLCWCSMSGPAALRPAASIFLGLI